jgi:hypothetical protein
MTFAGRCEIAPTEATLVQRWSGDTLHLEGTEATIKDTRVTPKTYRFSP